MTCMYTNIPLSVRLQALSKCRYLDLCAASQRIARCAEHEALSKPRRAVRHGFPLVCLAPPAGVARSRSTGSQIGAGRGRRVQHAASRANNVYIYIYTHMYVCLYACILYIEITPEFHFSRASHCHSAMERFTRLKNGVCQLHKTEARQE